MVSLVRRSDSHSGEQAARVFRGCARSFTSQDYYMTNLNALLAYDRKPPVRSHDQREDVRSVLCVFPPIAQE